MCECSKCSFWGYQPYCDHCWNGERFLPRDRPNKSIQKSKEESKSNNKATNKNWVEQLGNSEEVRPIDANALIREMREMNVNYLELLLVEKQPTLERIDDNEILA